MSLMRWFRKNNKKIMAVVVVIIMLGFIGGAWLQQLGRKRMPIHDTIALFRADSKITNNDRMIARGELEILELLRAPDMLGAQDLYGVLLGELLFTNKNRSAVIYGRLKQAIKQQGYLVSEKQINDIYTATAGNEIYWFLLTNEAADAGFVISNENVKGILADQQRGLIPALFNGQKYSEVVGVLVGKRGISEKRVLTAFGKLLAVMEYTAEVCSVENLTTSQLKHSVSFAGETIDAEFVQFTASVFAKDQSEPSRWEMTEQFEKYKKFFAGQVTDENPYGFGYKLSERVQLEYITLKLDDVAKIITPPTQEEIEEYYQARRELFKEQIPADPNDPNSMPTERIKSYAEVQSGLLRMLLQNKINLKAEAILQQAKTLADAKFEAAQSDIGSLSSEQFEELAVDYQAVATQLGSEHNIRLYTGKTGLLTAGNVQQDEHLSKLYLRGYGANFVRLPQIVFAIEKLDVTELSIFDVPKPKIYETIGPLKDLLSLAMTADMSEQIMVVMRIVKAEKAAEPENLDYTFNQNTMNFDGADTSKVDKIYAVADKVAEDLKTLAAMEATKEKVQEFIEQTEQNGWEGAIDKFNKKYPSTENGENEPNTFELRALTSLPRISKATLKAIEMQSQGNPVGRRVVATTQREKLLRNKLYSIVPRDANTIDTLPYIMEFKPNLSYYCLKSISIKRIDQDEYERFKGIQIFREDTAQSQSLAVVQLNPENIIKRMNFRAKLEEETMSDANTPSETEGAP